MKRIAIVFFIVIICFPVLGAQLKDGVYSADFSTDSSMFHVNEAYNGKGLLTVKDGRMTIHVTMPSKIQSSKIYHLRSCLTGRA